MKIRLLILTLFIFNLIKGQECENILYSDDSLVSVNSNAYIIDCEGIFYDTSYNFLPYLGTMYANCYKLYHHKDKWLIKKRWTSNDTSYTSEFYKSGKLKSKSFYYDYLNTGSFHYYESGQLEYGGVERIDTLVERKSFYKNGNVRHIDYSFAGSLYDSVVYFYPNGEKASITYHTPFAVELLGNLNYRATNVISEKFYDENGDSIGYNKNLMMNINTSHYPMFDTTYYNSQPGITGFYSIKSQKGYDSEMSLLKEKIKKNIKVAKSFNCAIAYSYLSLKIDKKGKIIIQDITSSRREVKEALIIALNKINEWEIGLINGKAQEVVIVIDLILKMD